MKFNAKQEIGLIYQLIFSLVTIFAFILTLFEAEFRILVNVMLGFLMLGLAYNNHYTFKRKYFTVVYLLIAVLCFVLVMV